MDYPSTQVLRLSVLVKNMVMGPPLDIGGGGGGLEFLPGHICLGLFHEMENFIFSPKDSLYFH